jgi:hypothetical protein
VAPRVEAVMPRLIGQKGVQPPSTGTRLRCEPERQTALTNRLDTETPWAAWEPCMPHSPGPNRFSSTPPFTMTTYETDDTAFTVTAAPLYGPGNQRIDTASSTCRAAVTGSTVHAARRLKARRKPS